MWMWVKYSKLDLPLTGFHGIQDSIIILLPGIRKHSAFQWWHNAFTTVSRYPHTDHSQQPWTALTSLLPIQSNVAISLAFHGTASPVADHLFALHVSQRQNTNTASSFPGYPALQEICGCYGRKHGIVIILPAANICFINVNFTLPCSVTIPAFFTGIFLFQSWVCHFFQWVLEGNPSRLTQVFPLHLQISLFATKLKTQVPRVHMQEEMWGQWKHPSTGPPKGKVALPDDRSPLCEMYTQGLMQAKVVISSVTLHNLLLSCGLHALVYSSTTRWQHHYHQLIECLSFTVSEDYFI